MVFLIKGFFELFWLWLFEAQWLVNQFLYFLYICKNFAIHIFLQLRNKFFVFWQILIWHLISTNHTCLIFVVNWYVLVKINQITIVTISKKSIYFKIMYILLLPISYPLEFYLHHIAKSSENIIFYQLHTYLSTY